MSLSEALGNEKAHYRYGKPSDNMEHISLPLIEIKKPLEIWSMTMVIIAMSFNVDAFNPFFIFASAIVCKIEH